ncbi:MAG TPA: hypothetical protein VJ844_07890 [Mucilaginibacter sp.]|nr:hypothetical protein [Mucilaginibacter sp.]
MDITTNPADGTALCNSCFTKIDLDDQFCNNCGYPLKGTPEEQRIFQSTRVVNEIDMADYKKKLTNAANTLYYLCGIFVIYGLITFFLKKDDDDVLAYVLPNFILAIVFVALGGYTKKKPLACLISGFSLYIIVLILNAVNSPATLIQGIIVKVIIIGFLVRGIKSAIEVDRIKKENNLA